MPKHMPAHPSSVTVTFADINVPDLDFDPNRTFTVPYNNHSDPTAPTYTFNKKVTGFNVNITFGLQEPPNNFLQYNVFRPSDGQGGQIFISAEPGLVLHNGFGSSQYGGTGTVVLIP